MAGPNAHFADTIAQEAMRLMNEEEISLVQAFDRAAARMARVPVHEAHRVSERLNAARPQATD